MQRFDDTTGNGKGLVWLLKERVKGKPIDVSSLSTVSCASTTSITSTVVVLESKAENETEGRRGRENQE